MGLFRKEQGNAAVIDPTLEEYQQCHEHRRQMLDSFKRSAYNKYSFIYPDATILMNRFRHTFMILRPQEGLIMHGLFADRECPFLRHVPDEAGPLERRAAVEDYRQQVKRMKGVLREDSLYAPKYYVNRVSASGSDYLMLDGYYVHHESNTQELFGGALFLDGQRIAKSAYWDPQPAKHFSTKIYDRVLTLPPETSTGWSSLVLILGEFDFGMSNSSYRYEINFPNTVDFFGSKFDVSAKVAILALRDFLCSIEGVFAERHVARSDKEDFVRDEAKAWLDSPGNPLE
jgi:hypothetical protein